MFVHVETQAFSSLTTVIFKKALDQEYLKYSKVAFQRTQNFGAG